MTVVRFTAVVLIALLIIQSGSEKRKELALLVDKVQEKRRDINVLTNFVN